MICLEMGQKIRVAFRNVAFDRLPVYLLVQRCEFCLKWLEGFNIDERMTAIFSLGTNEERVSSTDLIYKIGKNVNFYV